MKYISTILIVSTVLLFLVSGTASAQSDDESYTVGIFTLTTGPEPELIIGSFLAGMAEMGYVEGENLTLIYEGSLVENTDVPPEERLPEAAETLSDADAIFVPSSPDAITLSQLVTDVPIIFAASADPVGEGLVEDLSEPGGNVTGVASVGFSGRRLQLQVEIDPTIERVHYAYNPNVSLSVDILEEIEGVADALDIEIVTVETPDLESLLEAIEEIPDDIDAIYVAMDTMMLGVMPEWAAASARLQVGVSVGIYMPIDGALMAYGFDMEGCAVQAAGMVDQILKGADPAVLPVRNAELGLMVNLETAESLGITIPRGVLRQADLIIRPEEEE